MRLPSLLVPFPHAADNHQYFNARAFADTKAAQLLEQKDASPEKVANALTVLVESTAVRQTMQAALAQWHAPKAAEEIAELMLLEVRAKFPEVAIAQHPTSNIQHPTSRQNPISERKVAGARAVGICTLMLLWCLTFGVWCLPNCS
jgi:hypothetical protein